MLLSYLLKNLINITPQQDCEVTGLALDSRKIKPGDLFFAYPGTHVDGRDFIAAAIARGAIAALADPFPPFEKGVAEGIYFLPDLANHVGEIAARFYQYPSNELSIIGITGTSGKTSCSHFIAQALQAFNKPCGVIGTVGYGLYGKLQPSDLTTPDPVQLQSLLAELHIQNAEYVTMEVSSHSLAQNRVSGVQFNIAVFTNLTRDHLDYHGNMENYAQAKRLLFARPELQYAVLNSDDAYGQQWQQELNNQLAVFTYSLQSQQNKNNSIYVHQAHFDTVGITATVHTPWGEGILRNPYLMGRANLSNLLATLTVLGILGIPLETSLALLTNLQGVPGRMQAFGGNNKPLVVVDYSHKPEALAQALGCLREHTPGKVWCVFGCGGNRDRGKRPLMGRIAEQQADFIVVTDDNPRLEDSREIVAEILQGMENPVGAVVEHDRRRAIQHAIACAQPGDAILIAGKGHETYQIIGDEKRVFSDVLEVQLALSLRSSQ